MRPRALVSLVAAVITAVTLVSASGAATTNLQDAGQIDVSSRAAVVQYLRSIHVDPTGVVIQRGARNYAGPSCPGQGWSCTTTTHPVVQVASAGGKNTFDCTTASCAAVQVADSPTSGNTATCIKTTGLTQSCTISQSSSSGDNKAVIYELGQKYSGLTQTASYGASITQQADDGNNTACVHQEVSIDGSTNMNGKKAKPITVTLEAHQSITITQDSPNGHNYASHDATSGGSCGSDRLTQAQTLSSTAGGPGASSVTQNENVANSGPNMTLDIEENQGSAYGSGSSLGNDATFTQTNDLSAVAFTPNGPVDQTQSSVDGGILATVNQDAHGISNADAQQHEIQCEDAYAAPSSGPCVQAPDPTADFGGTYSLSQTQYGPVRKGVGTATQTGNANNTFSVDQSSKQDNDTGSGQTNVLQGDCSTDGSCTVTQNTDINGNQNTNSQSGSDVNTSTNCTGPSCTTTCTGPTCTTFTQSGSQLTAMNTDIAEFGYGGMRANTGGGTDGDGTGSITVSGITGPVTKALLYWNGPTSSSDLNSNASVTFAGTPITGTNIGTASSNCWENVGYTNSQSYAANVTGLVAGNGSYSLADFVKRDQNENIYADINGVALVVFYNDGNTGNDRNVVLWNGNDSNVLPYDSQTQTWPVDGWNETLTGVPGSSSGGSLDLIVSDGQTASDDAVIVNTTTIVGSGNIFQGNSTPAGSADASGDLWDIAQEPLPSSLLMSNSNTLNITSGLVSDCLSLVVAAANIPVSSEPVIESPTAGPQLQHVAPVSPSKPLPLWSGLQAGGGVK
jgi:hypothetical protein